MRAVLSSFKPVHWVIIAVAFLGSCTVCGVVGLLSDVEVEKPESVAVVATVTPMPVEVSQPVVDATPVPTVESEPTNTPTPTSTVKLKKACTSDEGQRYLDVQAALFEEFDRDIKEFAESVPAYSEALALGVDTMRLRRDYETKASELKSSITGLQGYRNVPDKLIEVDDAIDDFGDMAMLYVDSAEIALQALAIGDVATVNRNAAQIEATKEGMHVLDMDVESALLDVCGNIPDPFRLK